MPCFFEDLWGWVPKSLGVCPSACNKCLLSIKVLFLFWGTFVWSLYETVRKPLPKAIVCKPSYTVSTSFVTYLLQTTLAEENITVTAGKLGGMLKMQNEQRQESTWYWCYTASFKLLQEYGLYLQDPYLKKKIDKWVCWVKRESSLEKESFMRC